jgi:hypothetical protein
MGIAVVFVVLPIRPGERGAQHEFGFPKLDRGEAEGTETISGCKLDVLHHPQCVIKPARRNAGIGVWTRIPHSGSGDCVKAACYGTKLKAMCGLVYSGQMMLRNRCASRLPIQLSRYTVHTRYVIYVTDNIWYARLVVIAGLRSI